MSIMVGIGKGATAGVLIRDAAALERMEKIDTLVVDKTGTLTEGHPRVIAIVPMEGIDESSLLAHVAALERASEHPLAAAIVAAARERGITLPPVEDFASITGKGVTGRIHGHVVAAGNDKLVDGAGGKALEPHAAQLRAGGATAIYIAIDGKPAGVIAVADPVKASTRNALDVLRSQGHTHRDADRRPIARRRWR